MPIFKDINQELEELKLPILDGMIDVDVVKFVLDPTHVIKWYKLKMSFVDKLCKIEFHCKRLLHSLHTDRYKRLQIIANL